jgi:hypothetical protein
MHKGHNSNGEQEFLISIRLSAQGFSGYLPHRAQVANYLATFASSKQKNPAAFTGVLENVLSQLLEVIFQQQEPDGDVTVSISNLGQMTGIKLEFPVNYANKASYIRLAQELKKSDPQTLYLGWDQAAGNNPMGSILKVVAHHQAELEAETTLGRNAVQLFIKLNLETCVEKLAV